MIAGLQRPSYRQGFARSAGESKYSDLWRGLVGAWIPVMGPSGAKLFDLSTYHNHGTLTGMDPATDWVLGGDKRFRGYVLDFDAANDYISIPDAPHLSFGNGSTDKPFSFELFVKRNAAATVVDTFISQDGPNPPRVWQFYVVDAATIPPNGATGFAIYDNNGNNRIARIVSNETILPLNTWIHIVGTYDGSGVVGGIKWYVNAVRSDTTNDNAGSYVAMENSSDALTIARGNVGGQYAAIQVAFAVMYARVLMPNEIIRKSNNPFGMFELAEDAYGIEVAGGGPTLITGSDALSVGLAESPLIVSAGIVADALLAGLTDQSAIFASQTVSDPVMTNLSEQAGSTAIMSSSDSIQTGLSDVLDILASASSSDGISAGLTDSSAVAIAITSSDPLTITAEDGVNTLTVTVQTQDDLPAGITEAVRIAAEASASDGLAAVLEETINSLVSSLSGQDSVAVALIEVATKVVPSQTPTVLITTAILLSPMPRTVVMLTKQTYRDLIVSDNPVSYWRLGEDSGITAADEMGANPGTYIGGVTLGQTGALSGDGNKAAQFDGSTGYVAMGDPANLSFPNSIFTIEFWMKADDITTDIGVLGKRGEPWEYSIEFQSTGTLAFYIWTSGGGLVYVFGTAPLAPYDINWHHFVIAADGANAIVYKDAIQVDSQPRVVGHNMSDTSVPFEIGRAGDGGGLTYMKGLLDEIAVYNFALSPAQVAAHYLIGLKGISVKQRRAVSLNQQRDAILLRA